MALGGLTNNTIALFNQTLGAPLDCSDISTSLCNSLNGRIDTALFLMSVGIILQLCRKKRLFLNPTIEEYMSDSLIPELLMIIGFIFIVFVRFFT